MVLVDTSVWARHLRLGDADLGALLRSQRVLTHPFVLTELASRSLRQPQEVLALLGSLPSARRATDAEVDSMIEVRNLRGQGLGLVDLHLLAATLICRARLWSTDRRLRAAALACDVAYDPADATRASI